MRKPKREQMVDIFPAVGREEIEIVKILVEAYGELESGIGALELKEERNEYEERVLRVHKRIVHDINAAANLIPDPEVKKIVLHRYFESQNRKETVARFRAIMGESTIDRRIDKGLEHIAKCLKLWGTNLTVN